MGNAGGFVHCVNKVISLQIQCMCPLKVNTMEY